MSQLLLSPPTLNKRSLNTTLYMDVSEEDPSVSWGAIKTKLLVAQPNLEQAMGFNWNDIIIDILPVDPENSLKRTVFVYYTGPLVFREDLVRFKNDLETYMNELNAFLG